MDKENRMSELVALCNTYSDAYYNGEELVSDAEFDALMDELKQIEKALGYKLPNSPTATVGAAVTSGLPEIKHKVPMLSLDKVTTVEDVEQFINGREAVASLKMDGLSMRCCYNENGDIETIATRGNGVVGTNITQNISVFVNLPKHIETHGKKCVVDGEAICTFENFNELNKTVDVPYKHPRALASGTVSALDVKKIKDRKLHFVAWKFTEGSTETSYERQLYQLVGFGFTVTPWVSLRDNNVEDAIRMLRSAADTQSYPYDGICFAIDDTSTWDALGATSHHPRHSIAYKFEQEAKETIIRGFDFSAGRNGVFTPVACFDPVVLDGTDVSRASCHNVSYCENLKLGIGAKVKVIKAMQIIPQIVCCVEEGEPFRVPSVCPVCGGDMSVEHPNSTNILVCHNPSCPSKTLGKLEHFASKPCMDIDGLSEATLQKMMDMGYVNCFEDLYKFAADTSKQHALMEADGFGTRSVEKLCTAIENSRSTTLARFVNALGIPNVGVSSSKAIAKTCENSWDAFVNKLLAGWSFTNIPDFGDLTNDSIYKWSTFNLVEAMELASYMTFEVSQAPVSHDSPVSGKKFCITGSFSESRDILKGKLEAKGGIWVGGVSKKLDILFCGEKAGSKLDKAKECGVKIIFEPELMEIVGG